MMNIYPILFIIAILLLLAALVVFAFLLLRLQKRIDTLTEKMEGQSQPAPMEQPVEPPIPQATALQVAAASAATDAPQEENTTNKENGSPTRQGLILVADDNEAMRNYLYTNLSDEYEVQCAVNGGEALEMARSINPDVIVSDVMMPVLMGDELCRQLRSSIDTSHIAIILVSALSERENIIYGLEAGADDYMTKPFDLDILKTRIRNILKRRQHMREALATMDDRAELAEYRSRLDKEFMERVTSIIEQHMMDSDFSIKDFSNALGMSRSSVYTKIKTLTDRSPNDIIRIVRLNKAKELLSTRPYNITEVSAIVGFSDPKYFSTCFKKQFGYSPSKLLENH